MFNRVRHFAIAAMTCVMAILLCSPGTALGKSMDSHEKSASGDFFVDELFYTAEIEPEPLNNGDWKWPSSTEIASDHALYVGNDPVNRVDPFGLVDWDLFWAAFQFKLGFGLQAGIKEIHAGPVIIHGPAAGYDINGNYDLSGGRGVTADTTINLLAIELVDGTDDPTVTFGAGWENSSGWWEPGGDEPTQLVEKTDWVLFSKSDTEGVGWQSDSPTAFGAEFGLLLNVAYSVDFGTIYDALWPCP